MINVLGKNIMLNEIEYSDFRSKTFAFYTIPDFIIKTRFLHPLPPTISQSKNIS